MAWWYGPNICNYFKQNYNNMNKGNFGYSILNKNAGDLGNQISRNSICSQFLPQDLILTQWCTTGKYHTLFISDQSPVGQYPRLFWLEISYFVLLICAHCPFAQCPMILESIIICSWDFYPMSNCPFAKRLIFNAVWKYHTLFLSFVPNAHLPSGKLITILCIKPIGDRCISDWPKRLLCIYFYLHSYALEL